VLDVKWLAPRQYPGENCGPFSTSRYLPPWYYFDRMINKSFASVTEWQLGRLGQQISTESELAIPQEDFHQASVIKTCRIWIRFRVNLLRRRFIGQALLRSPPLPIKLLPLFAG